MKEALELFNRKDLKRVIGLKTELGYKTERTIINLHKFSEVEDWLRESLKNSVRFVFENETIEINLPLQLWKQN